MKRIVLLALLFCICGLCFAQQSIYVSANGNDDNDGLSEAAALKTLWVAFLSAIIHETNKITVIGTLTKENSNFSAGDTNVFKLTSFGSQEMLITGKPGATGAERAVLSGKGSGAVAVYTNGESDDPTKIRLENIEITGGEGEMGVGLFIGDYASVTLGPGAVLQGNSGPGVGIYANATCVIAGGEIRNNRSAGNGGGVLIMDGGNLIMLSGSITDNRTATSKSFSGGGVYIGKGGRFTMSGGSITNNQAQGPGGGVAVASRGRFEQTGGFVSDNTASSYSNIYRESGSLGSTSSSGSSSNSSSSSSGSSSSNSSKNTSGFNWHIPLFLGLYLQGWHQNLGTFGMPLQLGVEFDFGSAVSLALLGEAGGSIGYPYLLEGNLGGMAELYFLNKSLGIGFGGGTSTGFLPIDSLIPLSEPGDERVAIIESTYLRFALILRKESKTSFFGQLYANGDWGFGVQFCWDLFD